MEGEMMNKKKTVKVMIILLLSVPFLSNFVFAETIILKSGVKIEAKIIEKTDEYIKVDFYGTPVTYWMHEIERPALPSSKEVISGNTNSTYINKNFGISVTSPEDWHMIADKELLAEGAGNDKIEIYRQDINKGKVFMVIFSKEKFNAETWENSPHITLLGLFLPIVLPNMSTEAYVNSLIEEMKKVPTIKILEYPTKFSLSNKEWIRIIFTEEKENLKEMACFYLDSTKGVIYNYAATSPKEMFDDYKEYFNNTLKGIEIKQNEQK